MGDNNYNVFSGGQKGGVFQMSPRTGRPKAENPKNVKVSVRLDREHQEILKNYCEQEQVDKAEAIRRGISKLENDIKK